MVERAELDLIANYIASGSTVLVLGPNFSAGSITVSNETVPDFYAFAEECCKHFGLNPGDFSTDQEIADYLTRDRENERLLRQYMRERFGVKRARNGINVLSNLVWRRIYSFDLTDAVELAYRRNHRRTQTIRIVEPNTPISNVRAANQNLELIKLNGDGLSELSDNVFNSPNFKKNVDMFKWHNALHLDCELHNVLFLGGEGDRDYLFSELRSLRRTEGHQHLVFVCPSLKNHQIEMLSQQSGIYLDAESSDFLIALSKAFPDGRNLDDISITTTGYSFNNNELRDIILSSFTTLTADKFDKLSETQDVEGGIYSFYKGEQVRWSDIISGIYADLTPFKNWRNRISLKLEEGFPGSNAFLLTSPAGMGKSVGLMAAAYWLRQRTDLPILWLDPDGDFRLFLQKLRKHDFPNGVFIFIDDIAHFMFNIEDIPSEKFHQISIICTSRETRWKKYKQRFPETISVTIETLRKLNRRDAEEVHAKISRYGTTVHFSAVDAEGQIKEILNISQRDMLVLIRELGQGRKFDEIIKSEISDLSSEQLFAYLTVCLSDRNQVPLPIDLLGHAMRHEYPKTELLVILDEIGSIINHTGNQRTLRTRHAIIAHHILEPHNAVVGKNEVERSVRALLWAFSNYRIPIIVHHSNSGHARVFKTVINRRFLAEVLGVDTALSIYREFEKLFEKDGFFWQQYGLCQSQAGNYYDAVETLRHAYVIHQHFQIKHSLGAASLVACAKLGRNGLGSNEFDDLRSEGREILEELHKETGYREDLSIATLAELDMDISKKFDNSDEFRKLGEQYHRELAFYVRDHPSMSEAKRVYENLNNLLLKASTIADPDYDAVLDDPDEPV